MTWAKTPTDKLRHLRDFAYEQGALRLQPANQAATGEDYAMGYWNAMSQIEQHAKTLLEQLGRGE